MESPDARSTTQSPPSSASPASLPSPPRADSITLIIAGLVQIGALVVVIVALPSTLTAAFSGSRPALYTLAGLGVVVMAVAAPTKLGDILSLTKRLLPGGSSK